VCVFVCVHSVSRKKSFWHLIYKVKNRWFEFNHVISGIIYEQSRIKRTKVTWFFNNNFYL